MERIGFVGIGLMGHGMAKHLLAKELFAGVQSSSQPCQSRRSDCGGRSRSHRHTCIGRCERHYLFLRHRLAAGRGDHLRHRRPACRGAPRHAGRRLLDQRAQFDSTHSCGSCRARRRIHRRTAGAHTERGRGRPIEHDGRCRCSQFRTRATGDEGVLRKRHSRWAARPRSRVEAGQQLPCAIDCNQHCGSIRHRRQERAVTAQAA